MSGGPTTCANCGAVLAGRFCADCGQDGRARLTLTALGAQALEGLTNLDSRLWRTLRDFLVPGRITAAYLAGQRVRYLPPVQTYLVVALVFFAVLPAGADAFSAGLLHRAVEQRAAAAGISPQQELERARSSGELSSARSQVARERMSRYSLLMLVAVPLFGLVLHGVHYARGRDYAESLVLAIHLQTVLFACLVLFLAAQILSEVWWVFLPLEFILVPLGLILVYGALATWRVYGESVWVAGVKFLTAGAAHMVVLIALIVVLDPSRF